MAVGIPISRSWIKGIGMLREFEYDSAFDVKGKKKRKKGRKKGRLHKFKHQGKEWRIRNRTHYDIRDLKEICKTCFMDAGFGPAEYFVTFTGIGKKKARADAATFDSYGYKAHGRAWLTKVLTEDKFFYTINMFLPNLEEEEITEKFMIQLGQVLFHEWQHTRGLKHKEMQDHWTIEVPWMDGLKLRVNGKGK
jgi:hypothetical protein